MTFNDARQRVTLGVLRRCSTGFIRVNRWLVKSQGDDTFDGASAFVKRMALTEGELRLQVCQDGCLCQMEVQASAVNRIPGGFVFSVQTTHDPWCPWLAVTRGKLAAA